MYKKLLSILICCMLLTSSVFCDQVTDTDETEIFTQIFVRQELMKQYDLLYDTFSAAITLEDGSEITGIGYTDYACYYESDDEDVGFFAAGFIADYGYAIPENEKGKGLIIEDLDFTDEKCLFVYDYETEPYLEHCVRNGQYLKYGVDQQGAITYEETTFSRNICDESLGALYSYDTNSYLFDPDVGNYIRLTGESLFTLIDYKEIEKRVNQIIQDQDKNFVQQEISSNVYFAQGAIVSYLLSMQEETFLGYKVTDLVETAAQLDPLECIRITPDGLIIIQSIEDVPDGIDYAAKWIIGTACIITFLGSTAIDLFIPAARPLCGAISGAAIDVFVQVVNENKRLNQVKWEKVAVAAVSASMIAWLCPLAASGTAFKATQILSSKVLGKLAGYGVQTIANGIVSGTTNYVMDKIDGGEQGINAFVSGAAIGACCTAGAAILTESISAVAPKVTELLSHTKAGSWLNKSMGKAGLKFDQFIQNHQVHLANENLENILAPKSVHMAAKSAWESINGQTGIKGGAYSDLTTSGDHTVERHEIPAKSAYDEALNLEDSKRGSLPAIKMSTEDHALTSSHGSSRDAINYRMKQAEFIKSGDMRSAIQMDIDDITSKFGTKYNEAINQALDYAQQMGWW